jgi:molecular chaperone Hsp33
MLVDLGREKLRRMIEEQDRTEVLCEFCGQRYPFSREDMTVLLEGSS